MKTGLSAAIAVAVLISISLTSGRSAAEECDSADSVFGRPPAGVDAIVVAVDGGRPYFKYLASIDSTGRALFLPEANRPRQTRVAMLSASLFPGLAAEAERAANADRAVTESAQFDTSTLDGLLEAISHGAVGCVASQDGVDRYVTVYVDGQETRYECVGSELSEFNRHVVEVVSDAINETGEFLCP